MRAVVQRERAASARFCIQQNLTLAAFSRQTTACIHSDKISPQSYSCVFKILAPHSASLNPTSTKSSPTRIGRFTSIPSVARRAYCSSSLIDGSLSFKFIFLYRRPLVLKNRFRGSPLRACQSFSSSAVGFCSLMWRSEYSAE